MLYEKQTSKSLKLTFNFIIIKHENRELDIKVDFTIDVTGRIKDLKFEQQNKVAYFRNAIKNAMNKWHFRPAKLNGFPVESQMSKIFSFSLQG